MLILKKFNEAGLKIISEKAKDALNALNKFSSLDHQEKALESKKLASEYGEKSDRGKIMKDLFPEQACLYDQLAEIENVQVPQFKKTKHVVYAAFSVFFTCAACHTAY